MKQSFKNKIGLAEIFALLQEITHISTITYAIRLNLASNERTCSKLHAHELFFYIGRSFIELLTKQKCPRIHHQPGSKNSQQLWPTQYRIYTDNYYYLA